MQCADCPLVTIVRFAVFTEAYFYICDADQVLTVLPVSAAFLCGSLARSHFTQCIQMATSEYVL